MLTWKVGHVRICLTILPYVWPPGHQLYCLKSFNVIPVVSPQNQCWWLNKNWLYWSDIKPIEKQPNHEEGFAWLVVWGDSVYHRGGSNGTVSLCLLLHIQQTRNRRMLELSWKPLPIFNHSIFSAHEMILSILWWILQSQLILFGNALTNRPEVVPAWFCRLFFNAIKLPIKINYHSRHC